MGSLFSSHKNEEKKQPKPQPTQKPQLSSGEVARIKLQHQRDKLREKRKQIEVNQSNIETQLQSLLAQNKREQAKQIFQRKMLYDKFLQSTLQKENFIANSIQSVDQLLSDKEMADIVIQTNQVMKDIQSSIDIDKVQDAMLDMQENKRQSDQMNDLYKQYNVDDQEEIDAMYRQYETQSVQSTYKGVNQPNQQFVELPQPQKQKAKLNQKEQEQLAMLE